MEAKEIQIPTPWGHIAGKLWGSGDKRPLLAIHGWQDNAGSWDPLVPYIVELRPILAIDWPGHGHSSWLPKGMIYSNWVYLQVVVRVKEYFGWDKITLMSHSGGGLVATYLAGLYPQQIDGLIVFENIVMSEIDPKQNVLITAGHLNKLGIYEKGNNTPLYTHQEITDRYRLFDNSLSLDLECVPHLLKRESKVNVDGKYFLTRDPRVKSMLYIRDDVNYIKALIDRIRCPMLFFRAKNSPFIKDDFMLETTEVLKENNENFRLVYVEGTHHVHMNQPQDVAPYVKQFLEEQKLFGNDRVGSKL